MCTQTIIYDDNQISVKVKIMKTIVEIPVEKTVDDSVVKIKFEENEMKDLAKIAPCNGHEDGDSIMYIDESELIKDKLQFDPYRAKIINYGNTNYAYVHLKKKHSQADIRTVFSGDDEKFLNDLKSIPEIEPLGRKLLEHARNLSPNGRLYYYEKAKIYLEKPARYWSVKLQTRDRSLAINLKGLPDIFKDTGKIELTKAWRSYSRFKLSNQKQLEDAIKSMTQAKENSKWRNVK